MTLDGSEVSDAAFHLLNQIKTENERNYESLSTQIVGSNTILEQISSQLDQLINIFKNNFPSNVKTDSTEPSLSTRSDDGIDPLNPIDYPNHFVVETDSSESDCGNYLDYQPEKTVTTINQSMPLSPSSTFTADSRLQVADSTASPIKLPEQSPTFNVLTHQHKSIEDVNERTIKEKKNRVSPAPDASATQDSVPEHFNQSHVPRRERKRFRKFLDAHPTFCQLTQKAVNFDEVDAKLTESYSIDRRRKKPFICGIRHVCRKYFEQETVIEDHLFRHFFIVPCLVCGKRTDGISGTKRHQFVCKKAPRKSNHKLRS